MRKILVVAITVALIVLGGVAGHTVQTHGTQTPILADGGNGPGG